MKKPLASILVVALLAAGCTGSFNLTRKVYNFHRSQSEKWTDELCFLLVALTPIYGLATFADAIVFNSIEFWTGNNPVTVSNEPQTRVAKSGNDKVLMTYDPKTDKVYVASAADQQNSRAVVFERTDKMVIAKNHKGEVLYSSVQNDKGDIAIYDGKGKLIKDYPAGQIALLKEEYLQSKQ